MNIIDEIWKPVKGYEGLYEVSSLGRIKSIVPHNVNKKPRNKILKLDKSSHYLRIGLHKNKKQVKYLVHELVATAFLPPCPGPRNGYHIDHINGNPFDNRASNLQWLSVYDNVYTKPMSLGTKPIGSKASQSKLTEEDVISIRKDSRPLKVIAQEYGVCLATLYEAKTGKTWKHVPMP